ncbi:NAD-dependent epimerase/dehydratase family protein [Nitratireductor thuwali]|uniref:dTDP-glucose 4,6-dehydratase n=1 Tax=Nitratireductor thuwali TaxID=2267699 RepID=A0ABY5MNI3_9HYPH|nr:dTDP-glucose 4,6-dehydratase [Nitratireductor thuwali]
MPDNDTRGRSSGADLPRNEPPAILVTGGAGFIGSHLVDALLSRHPRSTVTVLDAFTYAADPLHLAQAGSTGRLTIVRGSVEDRSLLGRLMKPGALVFHLAAESHVPRSFRDPGLFDRVNRQGTRNVLDAALHAGVDRVIHFSTDEVYGSRLSAADEAAPFAPSSPYARSKVAAEGEAEAMRRQGLDVTILRPSNVIGPRQHREKLLPCFIAKAMAGAPFPVEGDGRQQRTFLAVSDLVAAVGLVLERGARNGTYNVAGAESFDVRQVAQIVADVIGSPCSLTHVADRPANDLAYMLDGARLAGLGFQPRKGFRQSVRETANAMARFRLGHVPPLSPAYELRPTARVA